MDGCKFQYESNTSRNNYRTIWNLILNKVPHFKLYYCQDCERVYEHAIITGLERLIYYADFPTISCKKERCPKCTKVLNVADNVNN